jgi:hypothetical protein
MPASAHYLPPWQCADESNFLISVAVGSTSQKNSKKGTTILTIDIYCPNAFLTRTLTHHLGLWMCINLPTPFATLFCCFANGSGWAVLFLGTTRGNSVARGMATSSWGGQDAAGWWTCRSMRANHQEAAPLRMLAMAVALRGKVTTMVGQGRASWQIQEYKK